MLNLWYELPWVMGISLTMLAIEEQPNALPSSKIKCVKAFRNTVIAVFDMLKATCHRRINPKYWNMIFWTNLIIWPVWLLFESLEVVMLAVSSISDSDSLDIQNSIASYDNDNNWNHKNVSKVLITAIIIKFACSHTTWGTGINIILFCIIINILLLQLILTVLI